MVANCASKVTKNKYYSEKVDGVGVGGERRESLFSNYRYKYI